MGAPIRILWATVPFCNVCDIRSREKTDRSTVWPEVPNRKKFYLFRIIGRQNRSEQFVSHFFGCDTVSQRADWVQLIRDGMMSNLSGSMESFTLRISEPKQYVVDKVDGAVVGEKNSKKKKALVASTPAALSRADHAQAGSTVSFGRASRSISMAKGGGDTSCSVSRFSGKVHGLHYWHKSGWRSCFGEFKDTSLQIFSSTLNRSRPLLCLKQIDLSLLRTLMVLQWDRGLLDQNCLYDKSLTVKSIAWKKKHWQPFRQGDTNGKMGEDGEQLRLGALPPTCEHEEELLNDTHPLMPLLMNVISHPILSLVSSSSPLFPVLVPTAYEVFYLAFTSAVEVFAWISQLGSVAGRRVFENVAYVNMNIKCSLAKKNLRETPSQSDLDLARESLECYGEMVTDVYECGVVFNANTSVVERASGYDGEDNPTKDDAAMEAMEDVEMQESRSNQGEETGEENKSELHDGREDERKEGCAQRVGDCNVGERGHGESTSSELRSTPHSVSHTESEKSQHLDDIEVDLSP